MKKIISISILSLIVSLVSFGQTYRIETGYSHIYRYGERVSTSPYHVIRAGVNAEFPLKYGFGFETGLKYAYQFGSKTQSFEVNKEDSLRANHIYSSHALDIPLHITFTQPIFWGLKLFGYAGPNLNIGLVQTDKVDSNTQYVKSGNYDVYKDELNRFEVLFGVGGGIQWKNYRLRSGYDWGINNISKNKGYDQRLKGWNVSFEYELK